MNLIDKIKNNTVCAGRNLMPTIDELIRSKDVLKETRSICYFCSASSRPAIAEYYDRLVVEGVIPKGFPHQEQVHSGICVYNHRTNKIEYVIEGSGSRDKKLVLYQNRESTIRKLQNDLTLPGRDSSQNVFGFWRLSYQIKIMRLMPYSETAGERLTAFYNAYQDNKDYEKIEYSPGQIDCQTWTHYLIRELTGAPMDSPHGTYTLGWLDGSKHPRQLMVEIRERRSIEKQRQVQGRETHCQCCVLDKTNKDPLNPESIFKKISDYYGPRLLAFSEFKKERTDLSDDAAKSLYYSNCRHGESNEITMLFYDVIHHIEAYQENWNLETCWIIIKALVISSNDLDQQAHNKIPVKSEKEYSVRMRLEAANLLLEKTLPGFDIKTPFDKTAIQALHERCGNASNAECLANLLLYYSKAIRYDLRPMTEADSACKFRDATKAPVANNFRINVLKLCIALSARIGDAVMMNTAEIAISYPMIDECEFSSVISIMREHLRRNQECGNTFHQMLACGVLTHALVEQFTLHSEDQKHLDNAEEYATMFFDKITQDHPLYYNTIISQLRVAVAKGDRIQAEHYHSVIMEHESHGVKPTHVADARRAMEKLDIRCAPAMSRL